MAPVENILKEALELPVDLRAQLASELLRSLPTPAPVRGVAPAVPTTDSVDDRSMTWEGGQGVLED